MGFEPSGTVAQHLGLQDIWDLLGPQRSSDTSGMTLWHAGTLLACWYTYWHSRQTHGIQTNDDHSPLNLVDFRLQAVVVGLWFHRVYVTSVDLSQSTQKPAQPHKPENMVKTNKPGHELAHNLTEICQITGI